MSGASTRYPQELLDAAESLTSLVAADEDFDKTMSRIAELAVQAVDGADECSISMGSAAGFETVAATGDAGNAIDDLQRATGEGPCMSSVEDHATFRIPVMETDDTWPEFSKRAAQETGIKSMLSFVLRLSDTATGAMNMLARSDDAFSDEDVDTGTLFAAQVAIALADALGHKDDAAQIAQLEEGIKTRQMIGQAVGILMATQRVGADEAFETLKTASQNSHIKLRDIADKVVERAREM